MNDSYVVQIYRRDAVDPSRLTGTVERIGNGQERAFNSMAELWAFLAAEPSTHRRRPADADSDKTVSRSARATRRKP